MADIDKDKTETASPRILGVRALRKQTFAFRVNATGKTVAATGAPDRRADPAIVEPLLQYIVAGNTYRNACCLSGISKDCFFRWIREGKEAPVGSLASNFYYRVLKANAEAEHRNLMVIQKGRSSWAASAWFLERRNPAAWGRKDSVKLSGDPVNPLMPKPEGDGKVADVRQRARRPRRRVEEKP